MKIADVISQITVLPLRRFADAWEVQTIRSDKRDVFEQAILSEVDRIDTEAAVSQRLATFERSLDYVRRTNAEEALRFLLDQPGYSFADEADLIQQIVEAERQFREYASTQTATRHLDPHSLDIYQAILEVAWEDNVSSDEFQLIKRLQRKLMICRRDHRVIEIRSVGRSPMTPVEIEQALRDLVSSGFVCQFRLAGRSQIVVPEEIAGRLRAVLGIVLQSSAYHHLAERLPMTAIRETLEQIGQPSISIRKDFLVERLIDGDVNPSLVLDKLEPSELDEILTGVTGQKPPSMKGVKIRHIIANFDKFGASESSAPADDPEQIYYAHLVELAGRQYEVLRAASVIQHDQNVDRAFERGVKFAFQKKLGHPSIEFKGNAHADGGVTAHKGRMVLWDCKSALTPYALTEPKSAQFLQYVAREAPTVVSPFLVISHDFTGESGARAMALKASCPPGTEIGLLQAGDLKWLCEKWDRENPDKKLPMDVLAHTGVIDRDVLELRLKLFGAQAEGRGKTQ